MNEHNILGSILAGGKSKRMGEDKLFLNLNNKALSSLPKNDQVLMNGEITQKKILPGSSEPQSLGEASYKDMTTSDDTQVIESVEQTEAIISEVFNAEENYCLMLVQKSNINLLEIF